MFTGIISAIGRVTAVDMRSENEIELSVFTPYVDVARGESIAVNGVCLTATEVPPAAGGSILRFHVSRETCARTNLGSLKASSRVNLERALRLADRLSGHLVQGHVDATAKLLEIRDAGECREIKVETDPAHLRYIVEKGSVALDGISLTVNAIEGSRLSLMIIPHTWDNTILGELKPGARMNLELDMIAKYALKGRLD
jgi:riboflavin synthase